MRWKGKGLFLTGILLLVLFFSWMQDEEEELRYTTARVDRGTISHVVTAAGTLKPVKSVEVGTYVSGPVQEVYVDFNSLVKKGQVIAKIDPQPFLMKVKQAEANLSKARTKVKKDKIDLAYKKLKVKRTEELHRRSILPQDDLDTAQNNYAQAEAQLELDTAEVKQVEAALEEARVNLRYTNIVSPVDGVVISRNVTVGQTVAASFQTPVLFHIAENLTNMQVDTNVSEADIGRINIGTKVIFSVDSYRGQIFRGKVVQVRQSPEEVQNVVTYNAVVAVKNPDLKLKPGMTATVTFVVARREKVLRVPNAALRFQPRGTKTGPKRVWCLEDSKSLREIVLKLGLTDGRFTEVLSGDLTDCNEIVVGMSLARDGTESRPSVLRWLGI